MRSAKWLVISFALALLIGCASTTIPKAVPVAPTASFDGNDQNSGILRAVDGGFEVTSNFLDRYDDLVEIYGSRFIPEIQKRAGVTGNVIDKEHMTKFLVMNRWHRSGFDAKEVF